MWPLGHAAVGYLCYTLSIQLRDGAAPVGPSVLAVLFGTQFPDLVDKPLAWYLGVLPTGRTLAHSLLVVAPLCLLVYAVAHRFGRAELAVAFAVGVFSHVSVDAVPAFWLADTSGAFLLWPFLAVEVPDGSLSAAGLLRESITEPRFYLEFVLAGVALLAWRYDGVPGLAVVRRISPR